MIPPNTLLQNRYRVLRLVSQGGMGAVYEAVDENLGTPVALKQRMVMSAQLQYAFRQEARLLARLNHPALVRVTDYFTTEDQEFLVMEFIPGLDLAQELAARNAPFSLAEVMNWSDQLLDALEYLHTQSPTPIFHRDIKPQNLKRRQRGSIALLDFGIAKGSLSNMTQLSSPHSVMAYTRGFAPLEQIDGTGTDARTDLYALAATLYVLLSNQGPADATTRDRAAARQQSDPLRPLHEVNAAVPEAVSAVLMHALALYPDDRPPSAEAMRTALHAVLQKPVMSPPVAQGRTVMDAGRTEIDVGSSAPTQLKAHPATELEPSTAQVNPTVVEPQTSVAGADGVAPAPQQAPTARRSPWLLPTLAALLLILLLGGGYMVVRGQNDPPVVPTATLTATNAANIGADLTTVAQARALPTLSPTVPVPTAVPSPTTQPTPGTTPTSEPMAIPTAALTIDPTVVLIPASKIAFYSQRAGLAEIYVMRADGSEQTRITNNEAVDWDPAWSPDGRLIAFVSNRDGKAEIYIMDADGSEQTRLTNNDSDDFAPAWSPDGQQIAFMGFRDGNPEIYKMNVDGSEQTRLTDNPAVEGFPSWSPAEQLIAFMSERDGNRNIYVMNTDGSYPTQLTTTEAVDDNPSWSPDGGRIAFMSERNGNRSVYVMNRNGSEQTRATTDEADGFAPGWSPDGMRLVFQTSRDGGEEIYTMNVDGSYPIRLTNNANDISDGEPSWTR